MKTFYGYDPSAAEGKQYRSPITLLDQQDFNFEFEKAQKHCDYPKNNKSLVGFGSDDNVTK